MRLYILFFFILCFTGSNDPYVELGKIGAVWSNPNTLIKCQIGLKYYGNITSDEQEDSMELLMQKKGVKSYVIADEFEFAEFGMTSVYVDILERVIHVFEYPKVLGQPSLDVTSFIDNAKKFDGFKAEIIDKNDGDASIVFSAPDYSKTKVVLVYDKSNYLVKYTDASISLEDEPAYRVTVEYSNYELNKKPFPYTMASFVRKSNKKLIPVMPKHRGYKVKKHTKTK